MSSKKKSGRSMGVRILAIALAAVMVLGMAYYIILLIGGKM